MSNVSYATVILEIQYVVCVGLPQDEGSQSRMRTVCPT